MARFDEGKALAIILYLAEKAGGQIDLYKLIKLAYFADEAHLHKWRRTITGDDYGKMQHGPTPSAFYDMLKSVRGDGEWSTDLSAQFTFNKNKDLVVALQKPDLDQLSSSDIETLDEIYANDPPTRNWSRFYVSI